MLLVVRERTAATAIATFAHTFLFHFNSDFVWIGNSRNQRVDRVSFTTADEYIYNQVTFIYSTFKWKDVYLPLKFKTLFI